MVVTESFFIWLLLAAVIVMVLALAAFIISKVDDAKCWKCRMPTAHGHRDDHGRWTCGRCQYKFVYRPFYDSREE